AAVLGNVLRAEAEFLLQHALGRDVLHGVYAERQLEMQTRIGDVEHAAEALDDRTLLGLHGVEGAEQAPDGERGYGRDCERAPAAASGYAAEAGRPPAAAGLPAARQQFFDDVFRLAHRLPR